ncbi:glycoside hydrolase family 16 protein [Lepidopterella palustris CBS 459.81]|uniref:Crh-like protein n=1 Tax=Lepidopterella palustris CBS 459.81 TaxID=1314670 RepID=A0A8E2JFL1_9PEZI|nr:glycoside hydrolase family 16 protein [Lepidopterella palustris CBS 459.81]
MRTTTSLLAALASAAFLIAPSSAQTYSNCNPLTNTACPADSALGRSVNIDFTQGASDSFTAQGSPTYDSNGVSFTVAKSGDSPQLTSKWYIMFGKVSVVLKAAPGAGIVSSFVMQSDDLDEIDWEWLGADGGEVQSNYFGKGQTTTYNRGAFHADPGNQGGFITYTVEWTASQIVWQINGVTVRTLEPANSDNQYPQTPMQIKVGAWSGGDPANAPGTIQWARGPTDYSKGPFTMQVKSISVSDYSTGTQYKYGDTSGTWQSIQAIGGKVNSGGSPVETAAPAVTSSSSGQPIPFIGKSSSSYVTPSVYPWVPLSTTLSTETATYSNYPGLPSGWTVSSSGKVIPPSSAPSTLLPASSTSFSAALPSVSSTAGESEVITTYDQQGFVTVVTVAAGASTLAKSYDWRGFLITDTPSAAAATTPTTLANVLENKPVNSTITPTSESVAPAHTSSLSATSSAAHPNDSSCKYLNSGLVAISALFGVLLLL